MPNSYLQSMLEDLVTTYETETNYNPIEIELDPAKIADEDIPTLLQFVTEARKRLFIFQLPDNDETTKLLNATARRVVLNKTAELLLASTSSEPKINPLKLALTNSESSIRAGIQIQRTFTVPKPEVQSKDKHKEQSELIHEPQLLLVPVALPELPLLTKQLEALGIRQLQDSAELKIKEHLHAFTDGLIPDNLPKGFYINKEKNALCYTDKPRKIPTALAPTLELPSLIELPSIEESVKLLPSVQKLLLETLLNSVDPLAQKNALITAVPAFATELVSLLEVLKADEVDTIVPMLAKFFILGGEAHVGLVTRLLQTGFNKKLDLEFLNQEDVQDALLSVRGIKNLQKLLQLPAEQREWWNTLVKAHIKNDEHHFNFNACFEAYSQIFLPQITEKKLTLPSPCPIQHEGHFLVTLNRVLDVLEHAQNPQEQCLNLNDLNWSGTGVHFAMTQSRSERWKQVAACMALENADDTLTEPAKQYADLEKEAHNLQPWLFRYMGQHWKTDILLADIQAQIAEIQKLNSLNAVQKNELLFILASTFANETAFTATQWNTTLKNCISLVESLPQNERSDLLIALSGCFQFKPCPSLAQIETLMKQCLELKQTFPAKQFKNELLLPLVSHLEHEGFESLNRVYERIEKTQATPPNKLTSLTTLLSFTTIVQNNRQHLNPTFIKLLGKLNEAELTQEKLNRLTAAFNKLSADKSAEYGDLALNILSQINISKSQILPDIDTLISALAKLPAVIPPEHKTTEQKEIWLKQHIIDNNLLPGCALGNGDISKLDDLLVDAFVDAIKKRSAVLKADVLKNNFKEQLNQTVMGVKVVPEDLRKQIDEELMPLFDAAHQLFTLLLAPNPTFAGIIERLNFFEQRKQSLLDKEFILNYGLGKSNGANVLSLLLTGKKRADDVLTKGVLASTLAIVHSTKIVGTIQAYFDDANNSSLVKDLDAKLALSWLKSFNDTQSITFFFKEELVQKKVIPALKKTLQQLSALDPVFEKSILEEAAKLVEDKPSNIALQDYKNKIEAIANYLNLVIDIQHKDLKQFNILNKQLHTGSLLGLDYKQKHLLLDTLRNKKPEAVEFYLKLTAETLEGNNTATPEAIDRAINGVVAVFNLSGLEADTQTMFFKMSMAYNLKSATPFPLAALNELQKSNLPEETKSILVKQIIQIISRLSPTDSPESIAGIVNHTQAFLKDNPDSSELCIALLKKISLENPGSDLSIYPQILAYLNSLKPGIRKKLTVVLTGLAQSKKDDTVYLSVLLEISKGLGRRAIESLTKTEKLFQTPPYPIAQNLNLVLFDHESVKLDDYCSSFDSNPFAKTGEERDLAQQFTTTRVQEAILSLSNLLQETQLPHSLQLQLARQLTYIEVLGYTDPEKPNDFSTLKKLTASTRQELKEHTKELLDDLRIRVMDPEELETIQLELLAHLREIYFRTTGLFPNTTQMLVLLLSLHYGSNNLLMRIKTGEGKSINTPMLSVLQWAQGGTVDQCTANPMLLIRDYESSCEPFFKFLDIESSIIQSSSAPEDYKLNGINCSTVEDMSIFRLAAKESKKEDLVQNGKPIHVVLDECDDALLDQTTLYKLVTEGRLSDDKETHNAQWIYPLAYQFIHQSAFQNTDPSQGKVWDEEEDAEQFRLFLNKQINGNAEKQNFLMASTNTQLMQWLNASCKAALLVENKHFLIRTEEMNNGATKKIVCVPLIRSTPKTGSIFTEGVQQALQARLIAERPLDAPYLSIEDDPSVLASQSARGLIKFYQTTNGRLLGISATPGDKLELQGLASLLGTQAIGVAPYAGDKRKKHPPIFTFSNEESIQSIHQAIDRIKCPVSDTVKIKAAGMQTPQEKEAFIAQAKKVFEELSHTQTQPVLIIADDFDEARIIGSSFNEYKKAGFKIQVVTGKESVQELDRIIKQAGQANTITVGTAMLAKGVDINTGDHPKALLVIQTRPQSDRLTTQIAGRAARNGKPGEWLPIYQIKPPQGFFQKIWYFLFPWYRQSTNEHAVAQLTNSIKAQDTLDRLYTQAIDEVQQALMQQVQAWESLLLEINPDDAQLAYELYQWREKLINELARFQETKITAETLQSSISQFKKATCKLWESARDAYWIKRVAKTPQLTRAQSLQFNYLKQLDISQELDIQQAIQENRSAFKDGAQALMHQKINTVIQDKAGAVLNYETPSQEEKEKLHLAQNIQLLPELIGNFCAVYPEAIQHLNPQNKKRNHFFLPQILNSLVDRVIEEKNKLLLDDNKRQEISQTAIKFYQSELANADADKVQIILKNIKPLIIAHTEELVNAPLIEQFKMQGLVTTFCTLYHQSGLLPDPEVQALEVSYNDAIMTKLTVYLINEFEWVKQSPQLLHAIFERGVAKAAANRIHDLALEVQKAPTNKEKIQALYTALQEERLILEDKYLFSISHSSPREVINLALAAVDSLTAAVHCNREFRDISHDTAVSAYHLNLFRACLEETVSPVHSEDPIWNNLKNKLTVMSDKNNNNQIHLIQELYETVERYKTYDVYTPYKKQLSYLNQQLVNSLADLKERNKLKQNADESLLLHKKTQFAALFKVEKDNIRIQNATDGIQSYIEVQIENAPLKEGFTGYQSKFIDTVKQERLHLKENRDAVKSNKTALVELRDRSAISCLSPDKQKDFNQLLTLKELLTQDLTQDFDCTVSNGLPEPIPKTLNLIKQIKDLDLSSETQESIKVKELLKDTGTEVQITALLKKQDEAKTALDAARKKYELAAKAVEEQDKQVKAKAVEVTNRQTAQSQSGFLTGMLLGVQNRWEQSGLASCQQKLDTLKTTASQINSEVNTCEQQLAAIGNSLNEPKKQAITALATRLTALITDAAKQYIAEIEAEQDELEETLDSVEEKESKKSRYQTRRFFSPRELLDYEARLAKEKAAIDALSLEEQEPVVVEAGALGCS